MRIPIRRDYLPFGRPNFSDKEIAAVAAAMRTGWVGMGPQVIAFEKELSQSVKAPYVVTVNSCTSALFLALKLNNVGDGDEVIVPSLTWCSTANAALYLGARPVFCDIDPSTLNATPRSILAKLTSKTKAVIVVHFGGGTAAIKAIKANLPKNVALIEDAAHAFGARYAEDNAPVGSSGNMTCFSFYANKNLSTGEGGALALFDARLAERARKLRQHGLPVDAYKRFSSPRVGYLSMSPSELGYKMNFTDLQAAIGRVQLNRQPSFYNRRLAVAHFYQQELSKLKSNLFFPTNQLDSGHARHLFVVLFPPRLKRDRLFKALRKRKIGAGIHYYPLHLMPLFGKQPRLWHTEDVYSRIITLPISASMTLKDAAYVVSHMKDILS